MDPTTKYLETVSCFRRIDIVDPVCSNHDPEKGPNDKTDVEKR